VGDSSFYRGNSEGPSKNQLKNDTRYFEEFCELEESGNLSLVSELKAVLSQPTCSKFRFIYDSFRRIPGGFGTRKSISFSLL